MFRDGIPEGTIIVLGSLLLFSVDWGDPLGTAALLVLSALTGAEAAMLLGSLAHNDQQAGALSLLLALGLAALGGCMLPLEIFPLPMKTVAHVTPHARAVDAYGELIRHGGGIGDVLPELGVLLAYALALFALGARVLRRALTG